MKSTFGIIFFAMITLLFFLGTPKQILAHAKFNSAFNKDTVKVEKKAPEKKENIGIGPIKELKLGPIDKKLVSEGKGIFNSKCMACHRMDMKLVGPPLKGVAKKYSPVFLMNYLLNTTEMQKKEPELQKLIKQYNGVVMPDQGLNKNQARAVIEFLRTNE